MKKKCIAINEEVCNNMADKMELIANNLSKIKSIAKTIIILTLEFDYEILPLAEILNNKIDSTMKIMNK